MSLRVGRTGVREPQVRLKGVSFVLNEKGLSSRRGISPLWEGRVSNLSDRCKSVAEEKGLRRERRGRSGWGVVESDGGVREGVYG